MKQFGEVLRNQIEGLSNAAIEAEFMFCFLMGHLGSANGILSGIAVLNPFPIRFVPYPTCNYVGNNKSNYKDHFIGSKAGQEQERKQD